MFMCVPTLYVSYRETIKYSRNDAILQKLYNAREKTHYSRNDAILKKRHCSRSEKMNHTWQVQASYGVYHGNKVGVSP